MNYLSLNLALAFCLIPLSYFVIVPESDGINKRKKQMYMVTTTWRHHKPIDKVNMRKILSGLKNRNNTSEVIEVMWFEIDEVTHGSVLIYSSKEAYDEDMLARNKNREDSGLKILREEKGETFAVMSEL